MSTSHANRFHRILDICPSQFLVPDDDRALAAGSIRLAVHPQQPEITIPNLKPGVWEVLPPFGGDGDTFIFLLLWTREREGNELALDRSVEEWEADEREYRARPAQRGEDYRPPAGTKWTRAGSYSHDSASGVILGRSYLSQESARLIMGEEDWRDGGMEWFVSALQGAHRDVRGCDGRTVGGISLSMQDSGFRLWKLVDESGEVVAVRAHVNGMTRREEHAAMGEGCWESDGEPYSDEEERESDQD